MWPGQGDKQDSVATYSTHYCHICGTQPLWEVLGGCRLFVAGGEWSYSVWGDVTCSPTPHHWCTQTLVTHTHTHTYTYTPPSLSASLLAGQSYSFRWAPQPPAEQCCHWVITNTHRRLWMSSQIQETNVSLHAAAWVLLFDGVLYDLHFPPSHISYWTWWNHGSLIRDPTE